MRVGFIGEPVLSFRGKTLVKRSPLSLLDEVPLAWRASPPGVEGEMYAGVVELDALQAQELLLRAQAAGLKLALVLDIDGTEGAKPVPIAEKAVFDTWLGAKGLPTPGVLEGQLDYVQRVQEQLNPVNTMDKLLADVEAELAVMPAAVIKVLA